MIKPSDHFNTLPSEYQNVLRLAQDKFNIEVMPLQELKGGRTGAYLFLASVSEVQSGKVRHLILKLDHKNKKTKTDESERHATALQKSPPAFALNHIAGLAFDRIGQDDASAIFYSIAGQSLHSYKALADYQQQSRLEKIFGRTNDLLLNQWNSGAEFQRGMHPQQIISEWLGYRLQPGGNIEQFMRDLCGVPEDTGGLIIQGNLFPNPLLYSRRAELWQKARPVDVITGFQHGDLNIGNILIKFSEEGSEITGYYLIDFALFKTSMPLFYDLSYLEMSYLIRELSRVSYPKWVDMVIRFADGNMADPRQVPIELAGACAVINAGRKVFDKWVQELHPSLSDDLWGQYWLSAAASGLNFCNKGEISEKERLAGLIFAAVHLKRYHTAFGVPLPLEVRHLPVFGSSGEFEKQAEDTRREKKAAHSLPFHASAFIGRQKEVKAITKLLRRNDVRMLTLTGPGGTGKTRLALQSALESSDQFTDGVYFIDLAPVQDPESVLTAIAGAIGLRESSSRSVTEEIIIKLHTSKMLLLLDNFEQVITAAAKTGDLIAGCPHLKLLITSREALKLRGEHVFPVPPLGLPDTEFKQLSLRQITQYEAVRLFIDRAEAVKPDFRVTDENVQAVAEICLRLDGLPLAIELAAARISLFPPESLLKRIEGRLQMLRGGAQDLPARQKTLRDTIGWSYEMLSALEQRLFSLFSVFSGCTIEALESIAGADAEIIKEGYEVLDGITSLADKSLIRRTEGLAGEPRLLMLETIREYAAEKLETFSGLAHSAHSRHAEYYAGFSQNLLKGLTGTAREKALNQAGQEIENMKTAWRYWVAGKNLEQLQKMTDSLWLIYDARGWYYSALDLTTDLLGVLESRPSSPERALQEIMLQTSLAKVLMSIKGCTPEVEKAYMQALELCRKYGEIPQSFPVLRALGSFYGYTGDFTKSAYFGKQILNLAEGSDNKSLKIEGMLLHGYSLIFSGNPKEGTGYLEKVIEDYNFEQHAPPSFSIGNTAAVTSHTTAALCLWMLGFPDRALRLADESISLAVRLKHPYSMAYALFHTGLFHLWRQEYDIVLQRADSALKIAGEHEFRIWKAVAVCLHGSALAAMGQAGRGLTEFRKGIDMYTELKTPPVFWPVLLMMQAGTYIQSGRPEEGLISIDKALDTVGENTGNPMLPEVFRSKGEVLLMISQENQAEAGLLFQRSLALAIEQQTRMFELRAAVSLNRLWRRQGKTDKCRQILSEAYGKFTEGFTTADLTEAQKLLSGG